MKVALITTVGGLIVAVILQIFFNYIVTQVEALTIDMENASISLVDMLVKYQGK
jgi:biopolymer transport protein ExbB